MFRTERSVDAASASALAAGACVAAALLAAALPGCAGGETDYPWQPRRPLGVEIRTYRADPKPAPEPPDVQEPAGPLMLRQALALALMRNPELAAASWEVRAAEARALQAGLMPNPEIRVRWDDWGGRGKMAGTRDSDQSVRLSQVIELGDKAAKRREVGRLRAALGGWDYEAKRLAVFAQTAQAFVEALAAEKRLALAAEWQRQAEPVLSGAIEAGKSGSIPAWDAAKAQVELAGQRVAVQRARREVLAARSALAAHWGSRDPKFSGVAGELGPVAEPPPVEQLLDQITAGPRIARWDTEARMRQAAVDLENAKAIPNLRVLGGMRREENTRDYGYFLALEMPLLLFDRNQGARLEAQYNRVKAGYERLAAVATAANELRKAYQALSAAWLQAVTLQKEIIPAAQKGCDVTRQAFERRELPYREVLSAQKTLFQAQEDLIDALVAYHLAAADVECLIGRALPPAKDAAPATQPSQKGPDTRKAQP